MTLVRYRSINGQKTLRRLGESFRFEQYRSEIFDNESYYPPPPEENALLSISIGSKTARSLLLVVCSALVFIPLSEPSAQDTPSGTILVTPAGDLKIDEGGSAKLSVSLSTVPTADVTVSFSHRYTNNIQRYRFTYSPTSLTFTPENHSTAQEFTVTTRHDRNGLDETYTMEIKASGGINAPMVSKSVSVTDDEPPPTAANIVFDPTSLTIQEGESGSVTIKTKGGIFKMNDIIGIDALNDSSGRQRGGCSGYSIVGDDNRVLNWGIRYLPTTFTFLAPHDNDGIDSKCFIFMEFSDTASERYHFEINIPVTIIDDDKPSGTILVSPREPLTIAEGRSTSIEVSLDTAPSENVTVSLSKTNRDVTLSPASLTFTLENHSTAQSLTLSAAEDDDANDDTGTIAMSASGGLSAPRLSLPFTIVDDDPAPLPPSAPPPPPVPYAGGLIVLPSILTLAEGGRTSLSVSLDTPWASNVTIDLSHGNPDLTLASDSITFTPSNQERKIDIGVVAAEDADTSNDADTIILSVRSSHREVHSLAVFIADDDIAPRRAPVKALALAIPPPESGDDMTLRIRCRQDSPCFVLFVCSTQDQGLFFEGPLPNAIPAYGAESLSLADLSRHIGFRPHLQGGRSTSGRLGCSVHSVDDISSQIWTRSGAGVLVNNSAIIRSHRERDGFVADIESIPSPDAFDESNIRIRCNSDEAHCSALRFFCYLDDGTRYEATFDGLARGRTLHLQSQTLAERIGVRWEGLGLSCEIRSKARFTAQVLTRTGGGGALINNSATGE